MKQQKHLFQNKIKIVQQTKYTNTLEKFNKLANNNLNSGTHL